MNNNERLQKLSKQAIKECKECGIPIKEDVPISISTRATKRYGVCKKRDGKMSIEISSFLFEAKDIGVLETIIHEYLHTCDGCMNHGPKWKGYADKMNKKFGYSISRVSSRESRGLKVQTVEDFPYVLECTNPKCTNVVKRMKMSKTIQEYQRYRCGRCGSPFKRVK